MPKRGRRCRKQVSLPPGYTLTWSGQYEYLQRARERLSVIVPLTLVIILFLLYLSFRQLVPALMVMVAVPLSLVGGFWLVYLLGYELSVAVAVGFIALAGCRRRVWRGDDGVSGRGACAGGGRVRCRNCVQRLSRVLCNAYVPRR